ncbi:hypothetical protein [Geoalkalibacter subterraneus]|uniref:Uncharacterized protein n=1 Tax=Geoalkalibacter subterraneus TaxID=483547 RepID=A0A0B5FXC2_9BACT|nr:hypothetical protein [Geoalkalibacter subterraneus]AJF08241.1 hypothetical protein GSUB_17300 [Geoalkalibacter subterraneus]
MDSKELQELISRLSRFRENLLDHINDQDLNDDGGPFDNGTDGYRCMQELAELESAFQQFSEAVQAPRYYLLEIVDDVEPDLIGPFASEDERDDEAKLVRHETAGESGVFMLDLINNEPSVCPYSGGFFMQEEQE